MARLQSDIRFKWFVCSSVLFLLSYHLPTIVNCDVELSAEKLFNEKELHPVENNYNVMRLVENRPSDVRIRSVAPTSSSDAVVTKSVALSERTSDETVSAAILSSIERGTERIPSRKCRDDVRSAISGIRQNQQWAIRMYDASVKEPSGVEHGDTYQFGSFDECLSAFQQQQVQPQITSDHLKSEALLGSDPNSEPVRGYSGPAFNPQYCLADVALQGYRIGELSSRDHKFAKRNSTKIFWGICIPDSCSSDDAAQFLAAVTGHEVSMRHQLCTKETREPVLTHLEIIYICIMGGFFSIVIFCTLYNGYLRSRRRNMKCGPKSTMEEIIGAFSLTENLKKLATVGSDELGLGCVNGIKAIAMLLIIAGHSLVFMIGGPVKNSEFFEQQAKLLQNAFFLNSPLLVDTFLLLSGFLFARLVMLELEKRKGRVNFGLLYIFRYIRLTPAYLAVIALYSTILPRLGSGPLWNYRIGLEQERCQSSWWANLLYVNNYVGTDKLCMFQSWYLSADTQLFILAPLILYPLWRCRKTGLGVLTLATAVTTLIPFIVTYVKEIDPTFLVFADEISDLSTNGYFVNVYIKTHMRATAYVFGLLTGYIVHIMQEKNTTISKRNQFILWITSLIAGMGSMFSVVIFYYPEYKYSTLESAFYAALHRLGWSYFTGWVVLACVTGYAGRLRQFFSARALIPISRLTYCAYLTNGLVELYHASSIRSPKYLSIMNLTVETLGHAALTFIAALILCLMFESPIHGIEKILLRRDSKRRQSEEDRLNNSPSTSEGSSEESGSTTS